MTVVARLAHHIAPVVDLIYPPRCPSCGVAIARQDGLCIDCWSTLDQPDHPEAEGQDVPVYAATYYNDISRKLVLAYKHGGRIALALLLARFIAARMPAHQSDALPPVLVPVPLHRWRLWQRGFNQAALLAQELARLGKGEVAVAALVRHKRTPNLGGLGRVARENVLKGAIKLNPTNAADLAGRHVILVDDVLTSGATSRACMAALQQAGPATVAIACFARVEDAHRVPHP
ncbi:MAG TPA: phosphoribosyltransferase family protein [Erythrobacter sp.]|nr:phosphoribosyltransferase family protein [Erythrobacter sp.]